MFDLRAHNRDAWNHEVETGNKWTIPASREEIAAARAGRLDLFLTPVKTVPESWYPPLTGARVLCLASGGGQQGPLFAASGARVTVLDNSPAQLGQDRLMAEREGLEMDLQEGDMRDLSRFPDGTFDLIFNPVSNCFVDTVRPVWRECARVLKRGGVLLAGFCNPALFIFDLEAWDNRREVAVRYSIPYSDMGQLPREQLEKRIRDREPLEFGHSLADQLGGQTDAGLAITGFFEDTLPGDILDGKLDVFIATRSVKP